MATFTTSIDVAASPEDAFAYLADFRNSVQWDPGIVSAKLDGEEPVGLGSAFDLVLTFYARQIEMRYEIAEFEPSDRVVFVSESKRTKARDVITVVANGTGSTVTYDATFAFGGVLNVFDKGLQVAFESTGKRAVKGIAKALS